MKKNNINNIEYISFDGILDSIFFEHKVLKKIINGQKLTSKEELFYNFCVSPTVVLESILKK